MRIVGITGGISCGKSLISGELSELGYPVVDGDIIARKAVEPGSPALRIIRQTFGDEYFSGEELNRKKLGSLIFRNPSAREKLDSIMAPYLMDLTLKGISDAAAAGSRLCFLDMPLLFEKGYDSLCDSTWCVWLPAEIQAERLMARDGLTKDEALRRISSVLSSDEKASRSSKVIDNSGTVKDTLLTVHCLLEEEKALCAPRRRRSERYSVITEADNTTPASMPARTASSPAVTAPPVQEPEHRPPQQSKDEAPVIIRSASTSRSRSARKVSWSLPSWLTAVLITVSAALLIAFTAQCLMNAYLARQQEKHLAEQNAIDANYPMLYRDLIETRAAEYNLNAAFVSSIIRNESSFRSDAVSSVGARGLMQLMPETAQWIAHKLNYTGYTFEMMFDPGSNITFGCWYLRYLSNLFGGDPVCVACAYHAGQGEIASWLSDPSISPDGTTLTVDLLPEGPTRQYAGRVTRDYGIYKAKYFTAGVSSSQSDTAVADY